LISENLQDGEEGKEAQIFEGCGEEGRPRHEEAVVRHAEQRSIRQEGEEQKTGDRDRPVRSPKEGRQGAQETLKEALEEAREKILKGLVRPGYVGGRIGHHPVVKPFISDIIERTEPVALGVSEWRDLAVSRERWSGALHRFPLRRASPVRMMSVRTASG
jgi:hypothetical protein